MYCRSKYNYNPKPMNKYHLMIRNPVNIFWHVPALSKQHKFLGSCVNPASFVLCLSGHHCEFHRNLRNSPQVKYACIEARESDVICGVWQWVGVFDAWVTPWRRWTGCNRRDVVRSRRDGGRTMSFALIQTKCAFFAPKRCQRLKWSLIFLILKM